METASLLPRTSPPPPSISPENLAVAALHISEALLPAPSNASTLRSFFLPNFSSPLRRRAYIFHSVYLLPLRTILISLLLLLTFLEPPSWCSATGCLQLSLTSPDPANPTLLSPTFQTFPLPPPSLLALLPPIEFVVYLLLLLELSTHAAYVSNPGPLSLFYSTHLFLGSSSSRSSSSRRGGLALPAPTTATTYERERSEPKRRVSGSCYASGASGGERARAARRLNANNRASQNLLAKRAQKIARAASDANSRASRTDVLALKRARAAQRPMPTAARAKRTCLR